MESTFRYFKEMMFLPFELKRKLKIFTKNLCCISLDSQKITLTYVVYTGSKPELKVVSSVPYDANNLIPVLTELVKQHQLEAVTCSWMLSPEHYQFLSQEALPVSENEFQAAIRWKIKELISFPIDDATIDHFALPASKTQSSKPMNVIIVSRTSYLHSMIEQFTQCGLTIGVIDIPELGYRNISALYEKDEASTALIHIKAKNTNLIITRQKEFYFSRRLEFGSASFEGYEGNLAHLLDALALEIQRSFDYFQSQWRYVAPSRVLLSIPKLPVEVDLPAELSQRLAVVVSLLDITQVVATAIPLDTTLQNVAIPVIGGALRDEGGQSAATS